VSIGYLTVANAVLLGDA